MMHKITDLCEEADQASVSLNIIAERDITIYAPDSSGFEQPVCAVEIWDGELRVLAWPDSHTGGEEPIITPIRRLI